MADHISRESNDPNLSNERVFFSADYYQARLAHPVPSLTRLEILIYQTITSLKCCKDEFMTLHLTISQEKLTIRRDT